MREGQDSAVHGHPEQSLVQSQGIYALVMGPLIRAVVNPEGAENPQGRS